jgi:hypothetical protein
MKTAKISNIFAEVEGHSGIEQDPTVDLRLCWACSAEPRDYDKFCRLCGARQIGEISAPPANIAPPVYAVSRPRTDSCRSVSAALLIGLAAGARAGVAQFNGRCARGAVSVLILIPLWLMIVLLSPFDAYATAKSIAGQRQTPYRNFGDFGDGRNNPWGL